MRLCHEDEHPVTEKLSNSIDVWSVILPSTHTAHIPVGELVKQSDKSEEKLATDRILEEQSLGLQKAPRGYTETKMVNLKTMLRNAKRVYAVQSNMDSRIWHSHITKPDIKGNPPQAHIHLYKIFYLTKFQSNRKNLVDQFGLPKGYYQHLWKINSEERIGQVEFLWRRDKGVRNEEKWLREGGYWL